MVQENAMDIMYFYFGRAFEQVLNTNIKLSYIVQWVNFEQQELSNESEGTLERWTELTRLNLTMDSNEWSRSLFKIAAMHIINFWHSIWIHHSRCVE